MQRSMRLLGVLLLSAACEKQPLRIAVGETEYGFTNATITAVEEANAQGGIDGRTIEIVLVPNGDDGIAVAARVALDPSVVAFVGHIQSGPTLEVAPIFHQAGIPVLSPVSTSSALAQFENGVYRFMPDDQSQALFIARQIRELWPGRKRIAVFYPNTDYGRPFRRNIERAMQPDYDVDLIAPIVEGGASETAAQIMADGPDILMWLGNEESLTLVLRGIRERDGVLPIVIAGDLAHSSELEVTREPLLAGMFYTTSRRERPNRADPRWQHSTSLLCYDLGRLVIAAMQEEGATRAGIHRYITSLGRQRPPFPGYLADISLTPENTMAGSYTFWQIGSDFQHRDLTM